jgi:hypothetical protein
MDTHPLVMAAAQIAGDLAATQYKGGVLSAATVEEIAAISVSLVKAIEKEAQKR